MRFVALTCLTVLVLGMFALTTDAGDRRKVPVMEVGRRFDSITGDDPQPAGDSEQKAIAPDAVRRIDLHRTSTTDEGIGALARYPHLVELDISDCRLITDRGIELLAQYPQLKRLKINRLKITNDSLKHLSRLTDLESLELASTNRVDGTLRVNDTALATLASLKSLKRLNLARSHVTDAGLAQLKEHTQLVGLDLSETPVELKSDIPWIIFEHLRSLNLARTTIGNDAMRLVSRLTDLEHLDLSGTQVDDQGISQLGGLTKLKTLRLVNTSLTGTGLAELRNLSTLESLDLSGTKFSDESLNYLNSMRALRNLQLNRTQVAGWLSLVHLGELDKLETLGLSKTPVTDLSLEHLHTLENLKRLALSDTAISDSGLKNVLRLKNLKTLEIRRTRISLTGIQKLRRHAPFLQLIMHDEELQFEARQ